ncbi:hypothetical protein B0H17DRAFT_1182598 [Mycena rosella]|uniref:Uncharacterized protein n=1 Tax=Mycena rosella TaxID=1033263 RepID=A0AAD7D3U4_MYCRO|nr:hypothetical protein B0H17DRAFT_1182598 [Mycena rosella]
MAGERRAAEDTTERHSGRVQLEAVGLQPTRSGVDSEVVRPLLNFIDESMWLSYVAGREQKAQILISAIRVYHLHQAACGVTSTSQLKKAETGNARIFTQKFDHGRQEETRHINSGSQFIVPRRVAVVGGEGLIPSRVAAGDAAHDTSSRVTPDGVQEDGAPTGDRNGDCSTALCGSVLETPSIEPGVRDLYQPIGTESTGGTPIPRREYSADERTVRTALRRRSNQALYPRPCPEGWRLAPGISPKPYQPIALLSLRRFGSHSWPNPTDYAASTGFDQLDCTDHRSALAVFKPLSAFDCTFGSSTSALAPPQTRISRPQDRRRRAFVVCRLGRGDLWRAEGQPERVPTGF